MPDTRPGRHALKHAGTEDGTVAHAVPMLKRSLEHMRDNLHVLMAVLSESHAGLDAVLVDDTQGSVPHVARIVVTTEGKRVPRIEPAVVEVPPF